MAKKLINTDVRIDASVIHPSPYLVEYELGTGDDLNDCTLPGIYTARTSSIAQSILNKGSDTMINTFQLIVLGNGSWNHQFQLENGINSKRVFHRTCRLSDKSYSGWERVV